MRSATDYYPFGMEMPGRSFSSEKYRFGFNGKEMDNEVNGNGNQYDYGFRIFNPRIARFLSVDPITKKYPELTPYQFASNEPISCVDIDGLERYYAADGSRLGILGDDKTVMVVNAKQVEQAKEMFANKSATPEALNPFSRNTGMSEMELHMRAFLSVIRHAEKHSTSGDGESYNQRRDTKGNGTPLGAFQIIGSNLLNGDRSDLNQDKSAVNLIKSSPYKKAFSLIIGGDLADPTKQTEIMNTISSVLGTPQDVSTHKYVAGKRVSYTLTIDAQWPSLPGGYGKNGVSQQGLTTQQSLDVFKNAISNELQQKPVVATPQNVQLLK